MADATYLTTGKKKTFGGKVFSAHRYYTDKRSAVQYQYKAKRNGFNARVERTPHGLNVRYYVYIRRK